MIAAEIFQAMRLADMSKVRDYLERLELISIKDEEARKFLRNLLDLFTQAKRQPPQG